MPENEPGSIICRLLFCISSSFKLEKLDNNNGSMQSKLLKLSWIFVEVMSYPKLLMASFVTFFAKIYIKNVAAQI
jgi:hypothetical protein